MDYITLDSLIICLNYIFFTIFIISVFTAIYITINSHLLVIYIIGVCIFYGFIYCCITTCIKGFFGTRNFINEDNIQIEINEDNIQIEINEDNIQIEINEDNIQIEINEDNIQIEINEDNIQIEINESYDINTENKGQPIKVLNIDDLNSNFNNTCPICLDIIEPIDAYKLAICDFHIYHKNCIDIYINNDYIKCPVCNI